MLTKIFYHILGLLVAFCLLFAVLITVTETLLYRVDGYFAKEYQKYAVTERVDMRLSDLLSVTDEMMDYLKGDRENLNVEAVIGGVQREFFNAKEKRHMQDVRELFLQGLAESLAAAGFDPQQTEKYLHRAGGIAITRTHGRREVAFLNRAWEDVLALDLCLDTASQTQSLLDHAVNTRPSRCVGFEGLGTGLGRMKTTLHTL